MAYYLQYIKDHSTELQIIIPVAVLLAGGLGTVAWFLVRRWFFGEGKGGKQSGISAGHDMSISRGVVAAGDARLEAEVIGGDKTVFHQQNFILRLAEKPVANPPAEPRDKEGRAKVEKIMQRALTPVNKEELKRIFQSTHDKALKIQIVLIFGSGLDPSMDTVTELIEMTSEAIPYAEAAKAIPQVAALHAYKGTYYTLLFTYEYQEYNIKLVSPRGDHPGMMEFYKRELDFKDTYSQECLQKAQEIAKEAGDHDALAAVYMAMGQSAAHRAATFAAGDIPRRLEEKAKMRKAFELAEGVYRTAADKLPHGGELEVANVKHNLANCLRMLGKEETAEAKTVAADVLSIAKKHGDRALVWKAEFLMDRLNGEPIPDYYNGEKGEDLL